MYTFSEPVDQPPASKTGVNTAKSTILAHKPVTGEQAVCQDGIHLPPNTITVDWVGGSVTLAPLVNIFALLSEYFPGDFEKSDGGRWYQCRYRHGLGVMVQTHPRNDSKPHTHVDIPSKAIATLRPQQRFDLIKRLNSNGEAWHFNCSRLDVAIDDYSKRVTPHVVRNAVETGNFTGFRLNAQVDWRESGKAGEIKGATAYIGRRGKGGSGKFIRCYDKWFQTNLEDDCCRFEVEFSQHWALKGFQAIASASFDLFVDVLLALVTGAIDFRDRVQDWEGLQILALPVDSPRSEWWEFLVGDVSRLRISKDKHAFSLERSLHWMRYQVAAMYATISAYYAETNGIPETYWWKLWEHGESKMSKKHNVMLAEALASRGNISGQQKALRI
jgi:hypothetical protein